MITHLPGRRLSLAATVLLSACAPAATQLCAVPDPAASSPFLATQILLQRSSESGHREYSISLTASGDALYFGAPGASIPGQYMGRLGSARFSALVSRLLRDGLRLSTEAGPSAEQCAPHAMIALSVQTADGRYSHTAFCAHTPEEQHLAQPLYRAAEEIRWEPGARILALAAAE